MEKTFGKWLLEQREKKGLSQKQLADRAEISPNYVSALEREEINTKDGKPRTPRIDKVDKLARTLGMPVGEVRLAAGYAPSNGAPEAIEIKLTDEVSLKLFNPNISPKTIKMLADVVRSIVENDDPDDIPEEMDYRNLAGNVYPFLKELVDEDSE